VAKGGTVSEAEHLPDRKIKSDTDVAIEAFVDDVSEIHPNVDREGLREGISELVREYVPGEDEGEEEEEEKAGVTDKAKGLAKEAAGVVVRNKEMKAEGRLEREGETVEGNRAYFRSVIEETNRRAAG
jgi:uncharacterized protein YjbJ (UPF0337 family)